jgi:hypothetical protein
MSAYSYDHEFKYRLPLLPGRRSIAERKIPEGWRHEYFYPRENTYLSGLHNEAIDLLINTKRRDQKRKS